MSTRSRDYLNDYYRIHNQKLMEVLQLHNYSLPSWLSDHWIGTDVFCLLLFSDECSSETCSWAPSPSHISEPAMLVTIASAWRCRRSIRLSQRTVWANHDRSIGQRCQTVAVDHWTLRWRLHDCGRRQNRWSHLLISTSDCLLECKILVSVSI